MMIRPVGNAWDVLKISVAGLVIVLFVVVAVGCSDDDFRSSMEKEAGPLLFPGYTHFSIDRENVDVGVIVFSYRTPADIRADDIVTTVRDQVKARYPCYSVLRQSAERMQIRCGNRTDRLSGAEEYQLQLDRKSQRLFVLWIRDVPRDADVYNGFVNALDEARNEVRR